MKLFKAVRNLYFSHIVASVAAIFLLVPLWSVVFRSAAIYWTITVLLHICLIYSSSWRFGDRDGRRIPGFYPNPRFAAQMAVWLGAIPLLLVVVRFIFPNLWLTAFPLMNGELEFLSTGIYFQGTPDMLYKLWYFPYLVIMGNGNFLRYLIPMVLETLVVFAGYYVGTKRFRIFEYVMHKLVFQGKKKN